MKRSKSVRNIYVDFQSCIDENTSIQHRHNITLKPSILSEGISRSTSIESSSSSSSITKDLLSLSPTLSPTSSPTKNILMDSEISNNHSGRSTENDYDTFWDISDDQDFGSKYNNNNNNLLSGGEGLFTSINSSKIKALNSSIVITSDPPLIHTISPRRLVVMTKWATEKRMSLDEVLQLSFQIPPSYRKDGSNKSSNCSSISSGESDHGSADGSNSNERKTSSKKRSSENSD